MDSLSVRAGRSEVRGGVKGGGGVGACSQANDNELNCDLETKCHEMDPRVVDTCNVNKVY